MLDIKEIRSTPDLFKQQLDLRSAGSGAVIDEILSCDEQRRQLETQKQELQASRKQISKQIGALKQKGEDSSAIEAEVRGIGDKIKAIEESAQIATDKQQQLLLSTPNIPHANCVAGASDADNVYVREWGEKVLVEEPEDHVQIATRLGLIDFEGGVRLSGSGFVVYRGKGAKLQRALIQFRNGSMSYLITTDLAARGLDIPEMKHVIHYHLPLKEDEFTHRNGRTARMQASGTAQH